VDVRVTVTVDRAVTLCGVWGSTPGGGASALGVGSRLAAPRVLVGVAAVDPRFTDPPRLREAGGGTAAARRAGARGACGGGGGTCPAVTVGVMTTGAAWTVDGGTMTIGAGAFAKMTDCTGVSHGASAVRSSDSNAYPTNGPRMRPTAAPVQTTLAVDHISPVCGTTPGGGGAALGVARTLATPRVNRAAPDSVPGLGVEAAVAVGGGAHCGTTPESDDASMGGVAGMVALRVFSAAPDGARRVGVGAGLAVGGDVWGPADAAPVGVGSTLVGGGSVGLGPDGGAASMGVGRRVAAVGGLVS
jgi:hypothetical protein